MANRRIITARGVARLAHALADPTRLRVLHALSQGELCVCQITALAGLAPSTISRHMAVLTASGLVTSRKSGRWVYYSLPRRPETTAAADALRWVMRAFASTSQAQKDARILKKLKRCPLRELSQRQRQIGVKHCTPPHSTSPADHWSEERRR